MDRGEENEKLRSLCESLMEDVGFGTSFLRGEEEQYVSIGKTIIEDEEKREVFEEMWHILYD